MPVFLTFAISGIWIYYYKPFFLTGIVDSYGFLYLVTKMEINSLIFLKIKYYHCMNALFNDDHCNTMNLFYGSLIYCAEMNIHNSQACYDFTEAII